MEHAISSVNAIDYRLRQNIAGFRFKKHQLSPPAIKAQFRGGLLRPPLKLPQTFQNNNFQRHSYTEDKKIKNSKIMKVFRA